MYVSRYLEKMLSDDFDNFEKFDSQLNDFFIDPLDIFRADEITIRLHISKSIIK